MQAEKKKRNQEASSAAYHRTIKERGEIPRLIVHEQSDRARLLAELGHPEFHIAREIVEPLEREEVIIPPSPQPVKSYVEDSVRRMEAATPPPPKVRSNVGVPPEIYAREVKRVANFLSGDFDPDYLPVDNVRRKGW